MKNIMKTVCCIFMITLVLCAGGHTGAQAEDITVKVAVPTGFPAISISPMAVENPVILDGFSTDYEVIKSPDLMAGKLLSGEADIAIVPTNLSVKLYNKGKKLVLAGSVVWGILYVVTSDDVSAWDDLKGQTVGMLGRGMTPDIVFRYLADANGVKPDQDVRLKYVNSSAELAPSFIAGKNTISIMPEPMLTMVMKKKKGAKIMLDIQKEWQKVVGGELGFPQASLVIDGKLIEAHPDYVKEFIAQFAKGVERITANPQEAGKLASQILDAPPAPVIAKAIPRGNVRWVEAQQAKPALEHYFQVLLDHSADNIGGRLPDDAFYYQP